VDVLWYLCVVELIVFDEVLVFCLGGVYGGV